VSGESGGPHGPCWRGWKQRRRWSAIRAQQIPATLKPLLQGTHAELVLLRDEAPPFLAVAARPGWVPGIGPDLRALPSLLDTAVDLTGAGEAAMTGLAPLLDLMEPGTAAEGEDLRAPRIQQELDYRVTLHADGSAGAELEVKYYRSLDADIVVGISYEWE
jgi:hypothetical protein